MKLRINNNSIRLRLSQSEMETIAQGLQLCQELHLGNKQVFSYVLIPCDAADFPKASFIAQKLEVRLPAHRATAWAQTDQVSLRHVQNEGTDLACTILIEKDFQCLHQRPGEDESDNFPNPNSLEDDQDFG